MAQVRRSGARDRPRDQPRIKHGDVAPCLVSERGTLAGERGVETEGGGAPTGVVAITRTDVVVPNGNRGIADTAGASPAKLPSMDDQIPGGPRRARYHRPPPA